MLGGDLNAILPIHNAMTVALLRAVQVLLRRRRLFALPCTQDLPLVNAVISLDRKLESFQFMQFWQEADQLREILNPSEARWPLSLQIELKFTILAGKVPVKCCLA